MKMKRTALIAVVVVILSTIGFSLVSHSSIRKFLQNGGSEQARLNLSCKACNVVMIMLTSLKKDRLGIYGYDKEVSIHTDTFFENALVFENAFAPTPWTLPSEVSLFTSQYPVKHGLTHRNTKETLPDSVHTLAEIMKENGYQTAAFTADEEYSYRRNIGQGFDTYVDQSEYFNYGIRFKEGSYSVSMRELVPHASEWISQNKDDKFFLLLQAFEPHCPYLPGPNPITKHIYSEGGFKDEDCIVTDKKYQKGADGSLQVKEGEVLNARELQILNDLYDGELYNADYALAGLYETIKELSLEKNTIVILMSEHGEYLGEHDRIMRGLYELETFYDEGLRIPFIMKHPRIEKKMTVEPFAMIVDVLPTLTEMLNIEDSMPETRQGQSLINTIKMNKEINPTIYFASKLYTHHLFDKDSSIISVRNRKWKYIHENYLLNEERKKGDTEFKDNYYLFDMENDPKELNNLYSENKEIAFQMEGEFQAWLEKTK